MRVRNMKNEKRNMKKLNLRRKSQTKILKNSIYKWGDTRTFSETSVHVLDNYEHMLIIILGDK
jgi:hypothetical protein